MNGQQFRAFLWLRWRIRVNQATRGGTANQVLLAILVALAVVLAFALFVILLLVGLYGAADVSPTVLLYIWDGLVAGFLYLWIIGLIIQLQRPEVLSLDKFLHLPVSLAGGFVINYVSSLFSLTLLVFVPAMAGLALGLVFSRGPALLLQVPLIAGFVLMVTAVTYQFQGWLAALMANKRRRGTIIALVTVSVVLISQAPSLISRLVTAKDPGSVRTEKQARQAVAQIEHTVRLVNLWLPPGWLPLGAAAAAEGNPWPAVLGTLGLTLIGALSLRRAYQTTVRLYTGHFTSGKKRAAPAPSPVPAATRSGGLLEKDLPWVSEQTAAIALGGFRSVLRAPEAKLLLLTPVILLLVFGSMLFRGAAEVPETGRSLIAFGATSLMLLNLLQLVGNQFGFDRNGFRVFVLCPAPRRDILLGKNLAVAPFALGLCAAALALVVWLYPLRLDHALALLPQGISMYLLFCVVANWLSIVGPMRIASGSLKPANARIGVRLLQLVFAILLLLVLAVTLLPLGVKLLLDANGWTTGIPVCLALSLLECVAVVYVYRLFLARHGDLLQARERRILQVVTTRAE